jgi:hypothetical protein
MSLRVVLPIYLFNHRSSSTSTGAGSGELGGGVMRENTRGCERQVVSVNIL